MVRYLHLSCFIHLHAQSEAQGYGNGDVRLAGTSLFNTTGPLGRLEVFMDKEWGTVCSISKGAARAVCHQLGYEVVVVYDTVVNLG